MIKSYNIFQKFKQNVPSVSPGTYNAQFTIKKIIPQDIFAKSNLISFRSIETPEKINITGFSDKDISIIQQILDKTKYGIDIKAVLNDNSYSIEAFQDQITLTNFVAPVNSSETIIGRCDELSYKIGRKLEAIFGNKYKFCAICNNNHTYLAGWHKDNEDAILKFISNTNLSYSINTKSFRHGQDLFDHLPQELLIIDPSYKIVGISSDKKFGNFSILYFQTLKDANPYRIKHNIIARYHPFSSNLTLGSIGSLFGKEYSETFINNGHVSVEFFKVKRDNKPINVDIKVRLSDISGSNSFYISDDDLAKYSPLVFQLVTDMRNKIKLFFKSRDC